MGADLQEVYDAKEQRHGLRPGIDVSRAVALEREGERGDGDSHVPPRLAVQATQAGALALVLQPAAACPLQRGTVWALPVVPASASQGLAGLHGQQAAAGWLIVQLLTLTISQWDKLASGKAVPHT